MSNGTWIHPGHEKLQKVVPFITDPLVFLNSYQTMLFESSFSYVEEEDELFFVYKGSVVEPRELPWVDSEKILLIAVNENLGDDVAIGLDYRTGENSPIVVGTHWLNGDKGCEWEIISDSISDFLHSLENQT